MNPDCFGKEFPKDNNYCLGCSLQASCELVTNANHQREKAVAEQLATASLSDLKEAQKALNEFRDRVIKCGEMIIQALQPMFDTLYEIAPIIAETIRQGIMKEKIDIAENYEKVRQFEGKIEKINIYKGVKTGETISREFINGKHTIEGTFKMVTPENSEVIEVGECKICRTTYPKKFADQLIDNPKLCYMCEGLERCKEENCNGILVKIKKWGEPIKKVCEKCGSTY
jgi:hypothetical protein